MNEQQLTLDRHELESAMQQLHQESREEIKALRTKIQYLQRVDVETEVLATVCHDSPFVLTKGKSRFQIDSFRLASLVFYRAKLRELEGTMSTLFQVEKGQAGSVLAAQPLSGSGSMNSAMMML